MHRRQPIKSFINAGRGVYFAIREERNMIIHLVIALIVIILAFVLGLEKFEFIIVLLCIALVLVTETINTAFEYMVDLFHGPKIDPVVKILKDVASAAVLMACVFSAIIGIWLFLPKIIR
ncbi:diacylglycerol kinase family protein [Thermoproteota archaeon]